MNQIFIVALFAILTFVQSLEPARDFVVAFLRQFTQQEVTLHEKCLGLEFDDHLNKILLYFQESKIPLIFVELLAIQKDINKYCQIQNFQELKMSIQSKLEDSLLFVDLGAKKQQQYNF